jgi:hypothetical protein
MQDCTWRTDEGNVGGAAVTPKVFRHFPLYLGVEIIMEWTCYALCALWRCFMLTFGQTNPLLTASESFASLCRHKI